MEIRICNSFENLSYYLSRASNHYCDAGTLRFFRSREIATIGNDNRAVFIETMGVSFDRSAGRQYKATLFEITGTYDADGVARYTATSKTIYQGMHDDGYPSMATQRKRAFAAAHAALGY